MLNQFSRTQLIYGKEAMDVLKHSHIAIFGVGGVGGYVVEALARSGVGEFTLIDDDKVCLTNCNRQIIATSLNVGKYKVDAMEERILSINPFCKVHKKQCFYLPSNSNEFDFSSFDYVVDAIDTVTAKIDIILKSQSLNKPIISAMGCGKKVDPTMLKVSDIYKTKMDPLCKVMRHELKKRGVKKLKVVFSEEPPIESLEDPTISCRSHCICPPGTRKCYERRDIPGSNAFVPPVAGIIIASEIVRDLTNDVARKELKR